jgi:hypothetical protein
MAGLDGNAVAGTLAEVFGVEMTEARCECAGCGARFAAAEAVVFLGGPGTVLRCRLCSSVLMVLVTVRGTTCVDRRGLSVLEGRAAC